MTNEQAIQILKQYLDMDSEVKSEYLEAQKMAIKALDYRLCIKEKCLYCPHCDNCDVDDDTLEIKALAQTRWIPVSERLPEDGAWAIFTDGSTISVERYKEDAIDHFYPQGRWFSFDNTTAWMPLPQPYTESEDKE